MSSHRINECASCVTRLSLRTHDNGDAAHEPHVKIRRETCECETPFVQATARCQAQAHEENETLRKHERAKAEALKGSWRSRARQHELLLRSSGRPTPSNRWGARSRGCVGRTRLCVRSSERADVTPTSPQHRSCTTPQDWRSVIMPSCPLRPQRWVPVDTPSTPVPVVGEAVWDPPSDTTTTRHPHNKALKNSFHTTSDGTCFESV